MSKELENIIAIILDYTECGCTDIATIAKWCKDAGYVVSNTKRVHVENIPALAGIELEDMTRRKRGG